MIIDMLPASSMLRIKNAHLDELKNAGSLNNIDRYLKDKRFVVIETSQDGFIITYQSDLYANENRNTFVFIDDQGNVMDIKFTIISKE